MYIQDAGGVGYGWKFVRALLLDAQYPSIISILFRGGRQKRRYLPVTEPPQLSVALPGRWNPPLPVVDARLTSLQPAGDASLRRRSTQGSSSGPRLLSFA